MEKLRRLGVDILCDLVGPECLVCERACERVLCDRCGRFEIFRARCEMCGQDNTDVAGCCSGCRPPGTLLDGVQSVLWLNGSGRRILHRVKLSHELEWLEVFDSHVRVDDKLIGENVCVVPVPMHWTRRFIRTFNQSELLAKKIAARYRLEYSSSLRKSIRTEAQSRSGQRARQRNLKGAFAWKSGAVPESVLLIDDVFTTGATLNECAKTLKCAGVKRVIGWTLFRTKLKNGRS